MSHGGPVISPFGLFLNDHTGIVLKR